MCNDYESWTSCWSPVDILLLCRQLNHIAFNCDKVFFVCFQPTFLGFRLFHGPLKSLWLLALCQPSQMPGADPFITHAQWSTDSPRPTLRYSFLWLQSSVGSTPGLLFKSSDGELAWPSLTPEPKCTRSLSGPLSSVWLYGVYVSLHLRSSVLSYPSAPCSCFSSRTGFLVLQTPHYGRQNSTIASKVPRPPHPPQVYMFWSVKMMEFSPVIRLSYGTGGCARLVTYRTVS